MTASMTMRILQLFLFAVVLSSAVAHTSHCCARADGSFDADVLILGAGMAGMSAAKTLHEAGITNTIILEARDRVGGRIRSEQFGGIRVEVGANWIESVDKTNSGKYKTNPMWTLKQRCGLEGNFTERWQGNLIYDGNTCVPKDAMDSAGLEFVSARKATRKLGQWRKSIGLPDISVEDAFTRQGWIRKWSKSPLHRFIYWFGAEFTRGESAGRASLYRTNPEPTDEVFGDGDFFVTDQRGFEHLVHCLAADINLNTTGSSSRLRLNTTVTDIYWSNECVCVKVVNSDGTETLCAKHAILTFSVGVLQNTEGIPYFHPQLPRDKLHAINSINMTHLLKICVKLNHTFWDKVETIGQTNGKFYFVFQPLDSLNGKFSFPNNSGVLIATVVDETADHILKQPVSKTRQQITQLLREMYPDEHNVEVEDILIPTWKVDPLYMGTYSTTPVGITSDTYRELAAPLGNLHFSGEATSEKFHGYVHGAYIAGKTTAEEVASRLKE